MRLSSQTYSGLMNKFLLLLLLLVGCAGSMKTQRALIVDAENRPVRHSKITILGDAPKFSPFGIAAGHIYTEGVTDSGGFCTVTFPEKRAWLVRVQKGDKLLFNSKVLDDTSLLRVTVVSYPVPAYRPVENP